MGTSTRTDCAILAAIGLACCGGSERQGGVKLDESRVVARCGGWRRALEQARAKQRARRQPEHVETLPGAVSLRGHQAGMVKTTPTRGQTLSGL